MQAQTNVGELMRLIKAMPAKLKAGFLLATMTVLTISVFAVYRNERVSATIGYNNFDLMDVNMNGQYSGTSDGATGELEMSRDGRYVLFVTNHKDLVPNDNTTNSVDVFVRDTQTNTTVRMVNPYGTTGGTGNGKISGNGRYVVYTAGGFNVFLYDMQTDTRTYIANNYVPGGVTDDGRFIVMTAIGPGNSSNGIYVRDTVLGTTTNLSPLPSGSTTQNAYWPSISCDGRFIAYQSGESTLVSGDTNDKADIFLVDRVGGNRIKNVTITGNDHSVSAPRVSCDGKYIGFASAATNLVPGDTNAKKDAFVYSIYDQTFQRLNVDNSGSQSATAVEASPSISDDGKYATFVSSATDLVSTNTGGLSQVYLRDIANGTTQLVSAIQLGSGTLQAIYTNNSSAMSANGEQIVFTSNGYYTNNPTYPGTFGTKVYLAPTNESVCAE